AFTMGDRRSKEDEVLKISTSIFVTNFLDQFNAKYLWNVCKKYGNVIDAFIPNKRSKSGKRIGFVHFIKIFDVDHLVNNLCTIWVGWYKFHANIARFQRLPLKSSSNQLKNKVENKTVSGPHSLNVEEKNHTLVLDDMCVNQRSFSTSLMGKVKEFGSLTNLKMVLANEASNVFHIYGRVTWVDIEGIPLKVWTKNTFNRIASKWGELLHVEGKVLWVRAKEVSGWVPDFAKEDEKENDIDDEIKEEWSNEENVEMHKYTTLEGERDEEEDSFNIYELLNKKQDNNNGGSSADENLKYPPGFTPTAATEVQSNAFNESKGRVVNAYKVIRMMKLFL
ncbi:nucleotide-binding alpha-beta plait domain-containing protein, partial [Tanacetum coccineum]